MKKQIVIPFGAAGVGVLGAVLKYIQGRISYDEKGLIRSGDPVTIALAVLSAAFCIAMFVISRRVYEKTDVVRSYSEAFPLGRWETVAIEAASVIMVIASVNVGGGTVTLYGKGVNFTMILGVCAGVCCGLLGLSAFFKKKGAEQCLFSAVPAVFFCFLMAMMYKEFAAKPVLSRYCYECIALGCAGVAFYCCAGYAFSRENGFVNVLSQGCAIYFLIMAIPGYSDKWLMVISASGAVIIAANLFAYLKEHPAQIEPETLVENDENKPLN